MMTTFTAAGIIPSFQLIAAEFGQSLTRTSYLTSAQIVVLGFSPLFWKPISNRYGRRPIWLISTACSSILQVGCAYTQSYGSLMAVRVLTAFFISPAIAIGSGVVTETFFARERGQKMGIWAPPGGPFIMGFVAEHLGWRWVFKLLAIINGAQFVGYLFFSPETRYILPNPADKRTAFKKEYLNFRRIDPTPLSIKEFYEPVLLGKYPSILIPTISYTIVFGFTSVLLTVEIPQLFGEKFHLNAQQIGLQFVALIIGSVIGEQVGGPLSDVFRNRHIKKNGGVKPEPERRLWLSYFGFLTVVVGFIIFGVRLQQAKEGQWNVTPLVGIGISAFGNQVITTILVTYAVDCHHEHSASIGVFVNLIRSTWGFIGPFWFPDMFEALGDSGSAGLMVGIVVVFSILPIILLQWKGPQWRGQRKAREGAA